MIIKVIRISKLSEIIILSIQLMMQNSITKLYCKKNFPEILNITVFINEYLIKKNNSFNISGKCIYNLYNLYSVVNHYSSLEFGHYNCFIS